MTLAWCLKYQLSMQWLHMIVPSLAIKKNLIINNEVYIREMEHNLLPPIIMRLTGLLVDKFPKFLCPNPMIETHSIFFPTKITLLTLALHGRNSYISIRIPKVMSEVNEHINLLLTSVNPDWDPSSPIYDEQESGMKNWKGEIRTSRLGFFLVLISL